MNCNAAHRITAGWISAKERAHIDLLAPASTTVPPSSATPSATADSATSSATSSATKTYDLVLWPFDRGESRGKLRAATLRLSHDKVLVLGYR